MTPFDDSRFAAFIRRLTGGKQQPSLTALSDAMPVVILAGDRQEDAFLRGDALFMAHGSVGAVAGQYGQLSLEMTAPSAGGETLAVLDRLDVITGTVNLSLLPAVTIGSGGSNVFARDGRVANSQGPFCRANVGSGSNAVPSATTRSLVVGPAPVYNAAAPVVVAPGSRLLVEGAVLNTAIAVNFWWRELLVPPGNR